MKKTIAFTLLIFISIISITFAEGQGNVISKTRLGIRSEFSGIPGTFEGIERHEVACQTYLLFSCYTIPEVAKEAKNKVLQEK